MHNDIWKKYQFVTEVQTALLANMAASCDGSEDRKILLATPDAALTEMNAVFQAAERIPEGVSAHDAAVEYVTRLMAGCTEEEPDFSQVHLTS